MVIADKPLIGRTYEALGLRGEDILAMYRHMKLTRALGERMGVLQRSGAAQFAVSGMGHEAAQVGSAYALKAGSDFVLPYYRDLGVVLTLGMTPAEVMLNALAKAGDPNGGGRQMPAHYFHAGLRIVLGSSPVATQLTHAAGIAYASKLKGESDVTAVYFGDGATSKGDFHEALNVATIHRLPVIFVCEDNGYAISVPRTKQTAGDIADQALGYGLPGRSVDGNDVLAVYGAMREAVDRARSGEGPTLLVARTYRLDPHTSNDDDSVYRSREEVERWRELEPIKRFRGELIAWRLLTEESEASMDREISTIVDEATRQAEASPYPEGNTALDHVYAGPA